MTGARWRRAMELCADALELPESERATFLDDGCAGDAELRREVESLLRGDRRDAARILESGAQLLPATIGPYRVLESVGEGGMGQVFLAEQSEPVQRRVAVKLIKPGMDSRQVLARFEAERQALAMMEHDNIAKVFDAGMADSGRPYFVMEYVPGKPLTEHCEQAALSTRERLELFAKVCRGVQHAHQKGVIHRDLKPSNILVTDQQGRAVPKIIDFGVAKATDQSGVQATMTVHGQVVGTPEYMSPEQAELRGNVDTRSDVYSLGVVLCELLTGALPFGAGDLRSGDGPLVQRRIRDSDPPRPSALLTRPGGRAGDLARRRGRTLRSLQRELRGDIDWIVLKALASDRERRYATPIGLADDIERHLADEPVSAGPPGARYRIGKFVRRNRGQVIAASAVLATLLAGTAGTTWFMYEAREQAAAEADARREAETNLDKFNLLANFVRLDEARASFADSRALSPAWPDKIDALARWIAERGGPLERELPKLERSLDQLRARARAPTEEDLEAWRGEHPRAGELARLQARHAALARARAVRDGRAEPVYHELQGPLPEDFAGLNLMAWPLCSSRDDRIWGREAEGLALARRALEAAESKGEPGLRSSAADTLAWALFANGLDEHALAMAERAVQDAPADVGARRETARDDLRARIEAARGDAGRQAIESAAADIEAMRTELDAERGWRFSDQADQFLHDTLAQLLDDLRAFVDPQNGELGRVRDQLEWARNVDARTILAPAAKWQAARAAIARADGVTASRLYAARPIDLAAQLGLVPIGANPATGLWEFYHLRSAADPDRIPRHGDDGSIEVTPATGIVFVLIPGGTFLMGAQQDDPDAPNHDPHAKPHETPHGVAVEPFFLARHELTQGQWLRLSGGETPSAHQVGWDRPDDRADPVTAAHPVEQVSWEQCRQLLQRHGLDLPAESAWEYACRAGTSWPWSTGATRDSLRGFANILDQTAGRAVSQWGTPENLDDGFIVHAPVGRFAPNGFGLYDMHGNVWEWCRGGYDSSAPYMVRGGAFSGDAVDARCALRLSASRDTRSSSFGVRAARVVMP